MINRTRRRPRPRAAERRSPDETARHGARRSAVAGGEQFARLGAAKARPQGDRRAPARLSDGRGGGAHGEEAPAGDRRPAEQPRMSREGAWGRGGEERDKPRLG